MAAQPLVTIGDVAVSQTEYATPAGTFPLARTQWIVQENVHTTQGIPTYAIVLAVLFFLVCLLGLLFLLVKEERTAGYVQVTVQGHGTFHATQIPVHDRMQVGDIHQRVNYVRSLVAALG
ncbi:MAG: hypothetical protein JXA83_02380 [Acidimicrobiales bacterium]|nr:hypothetical protein [Acidimicrobiales bacterium]